MIENEKNQADLQLEENLFRLISNKIHWALGFEEKKVLKHLFSKWFEQPTGRLAKLLCRFETLIAQMGAGPACAEINPSFFSDEMQVNFLAEVPKVGPLLVAANHPGAMDFIALTEQVNRPDIKIVANKIDILSAIPSAKDYLIFTSDEANDKFSALKASIKHLESGGALLIFPSGQIDPDPHFFANAPGHVNRWSESIEIFLRKIPDLQVMPAIASNAIKEKFLFNWFTRSFKGRMERMRTAEFLQVLSLLGNDKNRIDLKISFGEVLQFSKIRDRFQIRQSYETIKSEARHLMAQHLGQYPPTRQVVWAEQPPKFRAGS